MKKGGSIPKKKVRKNPNVIEITPPQTELDSNIRALLSHIVKHEGSISFELGELPTDGYVCWDIAERPGGKREITVWWAQEEQKGGNNGN